MFITSKQDILKHTKKYFLKRAKNNSGWIQYIFDMRGDVPETTGKVGKEELDIVYNELKKDFPDILDERIEITVNSSAYFSFLVYFPENLPPEGTNGLSELHPREADEADFLAWKAWRDSKNNQ